jgi:membrane-bound metal-dependent hydrolase YbcI (DUF457 family)
MDSLFHFIFPIIAVLAARPRTKHIIKTSIAAASIAVLLDLDHFIGLERALLHNIFVTLLLPLALLYFSFHFRTNKYVKGFFFLLLIFLSSHLMLDLFSSPAFGTGIGIEENAFGVALFYPLSNVRYSINFNIIISKIGYQSLEGYLVSSLGFGILLYFIIIIVPCLFLEDIIDIAERRHEKFRKAANELFRKAIKD